MVKSFICLWFFLIARWHNVPHQSWRQILISVQLTGFTRLYFKIAVMPLVLETMMEDVGKLISFGNLLAWKTTWLVLTTTSPTSILSRVFGAYCMTKIVYKYSHLPILILFPLWLPERTFSLSPFRRTESTHSSSFLHLTSSSQPPRKCILSATILFLVILFRWDFFQPRTQKFRQTPERNNQPTWEKTRSSKHTLLKFCKYT